jgi:hypothetical protein
MYLEQRAGHGSESGAAALSWFIAPVDLPYIPCLLLSNYKLNGDCPHFLYISLSTSTPQPSMSTPPQESMLDVHSHTMLLATTRTALSSPGQAFSLAENPSKPSMPMPVLDATQTSPPRRRNLDISLTTRSTPARLQRVGLMLISRYPALIPQFHSSNYYVIEDKAFSKKKRRKKKIVWTVRHCLGILKRLKSSHA